MTRSNIAFIGGGNMSGSMVGGIIARGWDPRAIRVQQQRLALGRSRPRGPVDLPGGAVLGKALGRPAMARHIFAQGFRPIMVVAGDEDLKGDKKLTTDIKRAYGIQIVGAPEFLACLGLG